MLTATVLTNAHKYGPAHFGLPSLYLMTNDHDRRDTLATPPPSADDIETSPHASEAPLSKTESPEADDAEAEAAMRVVIPRVGLPPRDLVLASDSLFAEAARSIAEAAADIRKEREERRDANAAQLEMQSQILAEVRSAALTSDQNFETLRLSIKTLAESDKRQNERLADGDKRFANIERTIADLKDDLIARIDALELQLAAAKETRDPATTS